MVAQRPSRTAVRTAAVWSTLQAALEKRSEPGQPALFDVLDAGGGSGGFAVPLAQLGHRVTVVDSSPDSLAMLERRAAEAGVAGIRGVQGNLDDIESLVRVADPGGYDVVLCHHVLEVVDDPVTAMAAVARALRPGGLASILIANRVGAVLGRVLAGRLDDALRLVADADGRFGDSDALLRRFDRAGVVALVQGAGLDVDVVHGAPVFLDLLPGGWLDAEPAALDLLLDLERAVAAQPGYRDIAAALHVLARSR